MSKALQTTPQLPAAEVFRKPTAIIAIVPANKPLTVTARKAYNVMGRMAQRAGDTGDTGYAAPLKSILRGFGADSNAAGSLKRYLDEMMTTKVEWRQLSVGDTPLQAGDAADVVVAGEPERLLMFTLVSQVELYKVGRDNWVRWWYPPAIRRQMTDPERWAQISLETVARLGTYAAVALYEICVRYKTTGRTARQHWSWWVPVLRGSEQAKQREWRKIKSELVVPALREINELSEIEITLVEHKEADGVHVQFEVSPRESHTAAAEAQQPVDVSLVNRALSLHLAEREVDALTERYGEAAMARALDLLDRHLNGSQPPADRLAHLKWILHGIAERAPRRPGPQGAIAAAAQPPLPRAAQASGRR
ncbi:replication initiation protein, partial [Azohydromonas lata]|uniref:replication initiation protein n=1 Tax=Azohydromonas lata TaxID=45677 RepID=UPI001472577F